VKLIIAGSRGLQVSATKLAEEITAFIDPHGLLAVAGNAPFTLEIVEGGEPTGVDRCGALFAQRYELKLSTFPANWSLGKIAGPLRNEAMARYADAALIFVDKKPTPGSSNMAAWMLVLNKPVRVIAC
jgi:hypothetical protein